MGRASTVDVVELDPADLPSAAALVDAVWGAPPDQPLIDTHTLRAFHLAGEQLLGAYGAGNAHDPEHLVGVSIAFVGTHVDGIHLHSHVTGVAPGSQGAGIGFALKVAQRRWAVDHGIGEVRWTFDPLIARNAHFNLTKLGAVGARYHPNVYGAMPDRTNAGDDSDRVEAVWDVTEPVGRPEIDVDACRAAGAAVILSLDGEVWEDTRLVPVLLACVPPDVVSLRQRDPTAARRWREAARRTIGRALDLGYVATGATRDGWWQLERGADSSGDAS